jgi:hypothetical protein
MPYATCSACTVVGPKELQYPYGIEIFTQPGGVGVCPLVCYGANNAIERGVPEAVTVAGYPSGRNEYEHVPPLGLTNETGETTPFREIVTVVHVSDQDLVIIGFFRYGDAAGEARVRAAYDLMLKTATAPAP